MRETEVDFASELDVDLIERNQRRKSPSNYKVKRLKCSTTEYTIARQRTVRNKERIEMYSWAGSIRKYGECRRLKDRAVDVRMKGRGR